MSEYKISDLVLSHKMNSLPIEVLAIIFSNFDKSSKYLRKVRLVSRKWKEILDNYFFKFNMVLSDDTVDYIRNLNGAFVVDTLTIGDFISEMPVDAGTMSRNKLALYPKSLVFESKNRSCILSQSPSVSEVNMFNILALNKNMESLSFQKNSLAYIKNLSLRGLYLQHLTCLEIILSDSKSSNEKFILLQLAKIKMPCLSTVKLDSRILALVFDQTENESFYLHLFLFLSMIKSTLKKLEFSNNFMLFPFLPPGSTTLPLSPEKFDVLKKDLSEIQLEDFSFLFTGHEGSTPYNLGFHLLENQTNLTKLEVDVPFGSELLHHEIREAVDRNAGTLQYFALHSGMFLENIVNIEDTFRALASCRCLEFLRLRKYKITSLPIGLQLPHVKYFEAVGDLSPKILLQLRGALPMLEELKFWHMISVSVSQNEELLRCLRLVLEMRHLQSIRCYFGGCSLRVLMSHPGIIIRRSHPRHRFYLITIKR